MGASNWNEGAPCRVSGDLRRHQAGLDAAPEAFDEHQDEHVEAVVGKRFAPAVQRLLLMRVDGPAGEAIESLRQACLDEWRDL